MAEGRNNGANLGFENKMCATAEVENDGIPSDGKMSELSAKLYKQFAESERLEEAIKKNLGISGYGR